MIIKIDWSKDKLRNIRDFYKIMLGAYNPDGLKVSDTMLDAIIETTIAQLHLDATLKEDEDDNTPFPLASALGVEVKY